MKRTVVELFAGVGGFRVGLNEIELDYKGRTIEKDNFKFVWMNQWEPSTKVQHAFECYQTRFGVSNNHSNEDISSIVKAEIPNHTLLVGGFPCQDYSVARSLSNEKGIEGKKGVLWWEINEILDIKRPPFVLLENVDRLLKSPSKQRGRDFGIMLKCFSDLGYGVEWRVINAADYGHPQRRRRVFIFAFHSSTIYYKQITKHKPNDIIYKKGIYARSFPISQEGLEPTSINISKDSFEDLLSITKNFAFKFNNSGIMIKDIIYTIKVTPIFHTPITLRDIIEKNAIDEKYFLNDSVEKFQYLKDSKKIARKKDNIEYIYSEGSMAFPDNLDLPGRTMLTSEGTVNRSTHVIEDIVTGRLRTLTPIEAERLNQFPDNWTNTGMTDKRRFFMMGNALVCGVVKKIGVTLKELIDNEK